MSSAATRLMMRWSGRKRRGRITASASCGLIANGVAARGAPAERLASGPSVAHFAFICCEVEIGAQSRLVGCNERALFSYNPRQFR